MSLGFNKGKLHPFLTIKIKTKRLVIRPFLFTDFKACQLSHQNRLPLQHEFDEVSLQAETKTYQTFKNRILRQRERGRQRKMYILGLFSKQNGAFVGQVDLFQFNAELKWVNLGYQIQNQYWGFGYAPEACRSLMKYAFKHLNIHRIEASMFEANTASVNVAKKLDLVYEGERHHFFPEEKTGVLKIYGMNRFDAMK